mmetsp:Transcript_26361/g.49893  ORF Transcript_26361/g.49893 Transcript_26361/m.49893 type:complete len:790 (+) Transcript_26361:235-2604(+)
MSNPSSSVLLIATTAAAALTTVATFSLLQHYVIPNPKPSAPSDHQIVRKDGREAQSLDLATTVSEYRRKIEVLLYMQEAVVNVMDFNHVLSIIVDIAYSIVPASRISVMVLSDDRKSMTVFVSKDAEAMSINATSGIAGYVAATATKVNIADAYNDPRFDKTIDETLGFKTDSLVCVPIHAGGSVVGVIQACNRSDNNAFGEEDERGLEALSLSAGSAIRKAQLYASAIRSNRKSAAILSVVRCRTSGASVPDLINVVTKSTYSLLLAERVSVYLVDRIKGEIWICVSKDPSIAGLTLPIGRGISGQVALNGETINLKDCYTSDKFDSSCDKKTGFTTRSMLCMAVPGFDDESKPVAVIQAINKIGSKSFDDEDEEALSAFCNEVKMAMRGNFLEAALLKLESDARRQCDIDSSSYLREFGSMFGRESSRSNYSEEPLSPSHLNPDRRRSSLNKQSIQWGRTSSNIDAKKEFDDFGFDLFSKSEEELVDIVFAFFEEFNLCDRLKVDAEHLQNLILAIHDTYNNVPFHNFYHAFSVCHVSYLLMRHCDMAQCLSSVDIFSCLIAALAHDCDHPGVSNGYLIETEDVLATAHNDDAVLERHHASTAAKLMTYPENDVFVEFSKQQKKQCRKVILDAILGTDMSRHMEHVTSLHERADEGHHAFFDRNSHTDRAELVKHIIHCADLAAQTLPEKISEEFELRVMKEFTSQALKEIEADCEQTSFMKGLEDDKKRCELQLNFVSAIVLPLWGGLAKLFPKCDERVERANEIRLNYEQLVKQYASTSTSTNER